MLHILQSGCGLAFDVGDAPKQEASAEPTLRREPDWVESERVCLELREAGQYGALIATEHMARLFVGWHPPSSHQVRAWRQMPASLSQSRL